jgi:transposase-like protein
MTAMPSGDDLFKGRHFDGGIIVLRARWRVRYKLGCRNLMEMMAEPDVCRSYDHHALGPARVPEFEQRWNRFARQVRGS